MTTTDKGHEVGPHSRSAVAKKAAAYNAIKEAILVGELVAGEPLIESSLAAWCGVSRTPVREALRRLEQDGLVKRDASGLIVRERSPEEILDLYDTRVILEATAARVAADRRTDHDLRAMRWALDQGHQVDPTDIDRMVGANQDFHQTVWRASHNESLRDLLSRMSLHLGRYPQTTLAAPKRWEEATKQHEELFHAIEVRDGDQAHEFARQHFLEARDIRLRLFAIDATQY